MISVYQTYFDEKSKSGLEEGFVPYNNEFANNDYFESYVMKQVYGMNPSLKEGIKYIGVTSWKQSQKSHLTAKEILSAIQKDIDAGTEKDVYIYSPVQGIEPAMDYSKEPPELCATIRHPDIWNCHFHRKEQLYTDNHLLNNSGVLPWDMFDGKWVFCHCNYWIARKEIFDEYCKTVLIPALEFFERPEIKAQMPKWYKHSHNKNLYNSCAFILEGLFGSFLAHKEYSYKWLCRKLYRKKYQDIRIDGYEISNQLLEA